MDEQSQHLSSLNKASIDAALSSNWGDAIKLNKQILEVNPDDTDCMNRLARAYFETGKYLLAKKTYQSALKIDPYNVIAQKNLKKLASFKADDESNKFSGLPTGDGNNLVVSPVLFVEEPGITKVTNLVKLAEPSKLSRLSPSHLIKLNPKNRSISITDSQSNYLGALPDDLSHLLLKLIEGGNQYQALIKSVKPNNVTILIRETYRSGRFKNQPSFIADSKVQSFPSDNLSISSDEDALPDGPEGDESYIR